MERILPRRPGTRRSKVIFESLIGIETESQLRIDIPQAESSAGWKATCEKSSVNRLRPPNANRGVPLATCLTEGNPARLTHLQTCRYQLSTGSQTTPDSVHWSQLLSPAHSMK